jgi:stage V sporulation protein B
MLRASVAELALGTSGDPAAAGELASRIAGYYRAAQTFAFVPYQLILAVTFVVFPTISRATTAGDAEATRTAIRGAMRFSLLVVLAMAAPISGASDGVMRVAYPEELVLGAPALGVLALGLVPFSLFAIGASILAGAGQARATMIVAAVALAIVVGANWIAVRLAGPGLEAVTAAAFATSLGAIVALALTAGVLLRLFGAFVPAMSVLRAGLAAVVGGGVAHLIPHATRPTAILACAVGTLAYGLVLLLLRELGAADRALVRRVLRR